MAKNKTEPVLRVRVKPDFLKEIERYVRVRNQGRRTNLIDRSHIAREAISEYMEAHPVKAA